MSEQPQYVYVPNAGRTVWHQCRLLHYPKTRPSEVALCGAPLIHSRKHGYETEQPEGRLCQRCELIAIEWIDKDVERQGRGMRPMRGGK